MYLFILLFINITSALVSYIYNLFDIIKFFHVLKCARELITIKSIDVKTIIFFIISRSTLRLTLNLTINLNERILYFNNYHALIN